MSGTSLPRLLKYPHSAVFDKAPASRLALRVRNPAGLTWAIDGNVLRLEVGQDAEWNGSIDFGGSYDFGLTTRVYSLVGKSIGQLANELRADGHEVVFEDEDMARRGAHVLISGGANQDDTNGDHLSGYTSLLWSILDAYAGEIDEAEYQSGQALRQMVLTQAEGEWLDVWAGLYGVPRLVGEADAELQERIPEEVFRLRVNGLAIEKAVQDVAAQEVVIDEPWKRMFILDESGLSGSHNMHDGQFYTYHVIQPIGHPGTDWGAALPVVRRNKAAGVDIHSPLTHFSPFEITIQPPVEYRIERGRMDARGAAIWGAKDMVLGEMRLSAHGITINHPVAQHHWWVIPPTPMIAYDGIHTYGGEVTYSDRHDTLHQGLQIHQQIDPHRTIAMAAIVLSDGEALGEENAVLGRGAERVEFDPEPIPSDEMFLSGYGAERVLERVEAIRTAAYVDGELVYTFVPEAEQAGHTDVRGFTSNEAYPERTWYGEVFNFNGTTTYGGGLFYGSATGPATWDSSTWIGRRHVGMAITNTPA